MNKTLEEKRQTNKLRKKGRRRSTYDDNSPTNSGHVFSRAGQLTLWLLQFYLLLCLNHSFNRKLTY